MVSTAGKSCRDLRAEGGDTEERNETGLMDGTYELREKKKDELKSDNTHLHLLN